MPTSPPTRALARARLIALLVPFVALAGAYGSQYLGGLYPCEMCWWQRYAHMTALAVAVLSFAAPTRRELVALAGAAIAVSAAIGFYHAGVEYKWWEGHTACTSTVHFTAGQDALAAIMAAPNVRCDEAQWTLLGVSLAGFNFLFSGLGAAAVFALLARRA